MRTLIKKPNKKGAGPLIFVIVVIAVIVIGMMLAFISGMLNWFSDEITPTFEDLGVIGSTNFTSIADVTLTPVNKIINSMQWMAGIMYFIMLLGTLMMAYGFRNSGNNIYLVLFFVLMVVAVIMSIWVSNTYEGFYNQGDAIALQLQDMTLASFLIINAPVIMVVIGFIGGIIMMMPSEREGIY